MNTMLVTVCFLLSLSFVTGDDIQLLASASSGFSQKLYQKIALDKTNVVYSPYSIHSALTMTSLGARGETATEMVKTLDLTLLPGDRAHRAYHDLILLLNKETSVKLLTANAVYINPNIPIDIQFVDDVKNDYLAISDNFDFAAVGGPEKEINDFVSNKTEGVIKNVLAKGSIDALTAMILVNTIFFNGTWVTKFETAKTHKQDFHQLGTETKLQVDMMYDERPVNIKRNVNGVDVAELPYVGGRFSLYIALPQTMDGITALENSLAIPGKVDQFFEGLTETRVRLSIPKFKIETKLNLNSPLQQLGIVQAFDSHAANLQGISSKGNIVLTDVIHKAVIEVKETGTLAAAAAVIHMEAPSVQLPPREIFLADHSFVFFLRDNQTKNILFQGKFSG